MNLYHVVRPIATLVFKIYFKKIYYTGTEKIPHGKPLIFSCNHQTGFFEPCLLACLTWDVEYHFITRGDMFKKPWVRRIFASLNMVPIFRFKDGFSNLKNNAASMEYIYKALAEKKSILIFSEGGTKTVKRLRPIQKGMARMAFGNYDIYGDLDLHFVPVCLTYTSPHNFRSEVMIQFGEAIPLSKYYETYSDNNNKAINQLTSDVQDAMRPLLVEIPTPDNDKLTENVFTLYRNTYPEPVFPIMNVSKRRLMAHQEMATNIDRLDESQLTALQQSVKTYFDKLKAQGLNDVGVAQPWYAQSKTFLMLVLGFIPFMIGYVGHWLPTWYALKVKNDRVPHLEFKGPVMATVGMGGIILQYIVFTIIAFIVNHWAIYTLLVLMPLLGYYAIIYKDLWKKYKAASRLKALDTEGVIQLRNEREAILKTVR